MDEGVLHYVRMQQLVRTSIEDYLSNNFPSATQALFEIPAHQPAS